MTIRGFDLTKMEDRWVCHFVFVFNGEEQAVREYGHWLLSALWNAWRRATMYEKMLKAATRYSIRNGG